MIWGVGIYLVLGCLLAGLSVDDPKKETREGLLVVTLFWPFILLLAIGCLLGKAIKR